MRTSLHRATIYTFASLILAGCSPRSDRDQPRPPSQAKLNNTNIDVAQEHFEKMLSEHKFAHPALTTTYGLVNEIVSKTLPSHIEWNGVNNERSSPNELVIFVVDSRRMIAASNGDCFQDDNETSLECIATYALQNNCIAYTNRTIACDADLLLSVQFLALLRGFKIFLGVISWLYENNRLEEYREKALNSTIDEFLNEFLLKSGALVGKDFTPYKVNQALIGYLDQMSGTSSNDRADLTGDVYSQFDSFNDDGTFLDIKTMWKTTERGYLSFIFTHEIGHIVNDHQKGERFLLMAIDRNPAQEQDSRVVRLEAEADEYARKSLMADKWGVSSILAPFLLLDLNMLTVLQTARQANGGNLDAEEMFDWPESRLNLWIKLYLEEICTNSHLLMMDRYVKLAKSVSDNESKIRYPTLDAIMEARGRAYDLCSLPRERLKISLQLRSTLHSYFLLVVSRS